VNQARKEGVHRILVRGAREANPNGLTSLNAPSVVATHPAFVSTVEKLPLHLTLCGWRHILCFLSRLQTPA
jgi:hypothetical protein